MFWPPLGLAQAQVRVNKRTTVHVAIFTVNQSQAGGPEPSWSAGGSKISIHSSLLTAQLSHLIKTKNVAQWLLVAPTILLLITVRPVVITEDKQWRDPLLTVFVQNLLGTVMGHSFTAAPLFYELNVNY